MKLRTNKPALLGRVTVLPIVGETEISQDGSFVVENDETAEVLLSITDLGLVKDVEVEKLTITSAGNVGLGGPPPSAKLDIQQDTGDLKLQSTEKAAEVVKTPEAVKPGPKPVTKPVVLAPVKPEVVKTSVEGVVVTDSSVTK